MRVFRLENAHWQTGIIPEFGGSVVFGRIRRSGVWLDVIRPTPPDQYSKPSSFLMLPWANRIRGGLLRFNGEAWQLKTSPDDGTARHGDVRKRPWDVVESSETRIQMMLDSKSFDDFNFPFAFTATMTYELDGADFIWQVDLASQDERPFPAGFGFHPYFQRSGESMPQLQVPCSHYYKLTDAMPDAAAEPVPAALDFQQPRGVAEDMTLDDLFTKRDLGKPIRLIYKDWATEIHMKADPLFQHIILFKAPDGSIAVEPQTNANDGFNLRENGIEGSGVFVVQPGETVSGTVRLTVQTG